MTCSQKSKASASVTSMDDLHISLMDIGHLSIKGMGPLNVITKKTFESDVKDKLRWVYIIINRKTFLFTNLFLGL